MKKTASRFLIFMFVLLTCLFSISCGSKYKKFEYEIYYAYSADAEEWTKVDNNITIHYGEGDEFFDITNPEKNTIYFKVYVKNVKSKDLGKIGVSSNSSYNTGFNFVSKNVDQGEVFSAVITDACSTELRFYEYNSTKEKTITFNAYSKITGMEIRSDELVSAVADKPGEKVYLSDINNIKYLPEFKTDQTGVTYSLKDQSLSNVVEIGQETEAGINHGKWYIIIDADFFQNGRFEDGAKVYNVPVVATSVYSPEDASEQDKITTEFLVFAVPSQKKENFKINFENGNSVFNVEEIFELDENGEIKLDENNNPIVKEIKYNYTDIDLCVGDNVYQSTKLFVDTSSMTTTYFNPQIIDQAGRYLQARFVAKVDGQFYKLTEQGQINGIKITDNGDNSYTILAINNDMKQNSIDLGYVVTLYEADGTIVRDLEKGDVWHNLTVKKSVLPNKITINNVDYADQEENLDKAIVYNTNLANYKGYSLNLKVSPVDIHSTISNKIIIEQNNLVTLYNSKNRAYSFTDNQLVLDANTTVYVKFNSAETSDTSLTIKTLKTPETYNGENVSKEYISVRHNLTQKISANSVEFYKDSNCLNKADDLTYINAVTGSNVYLKVYFYGKTLDTSSIYLTSNNDNVIFGLGSTTNSGTSLQEINAVSNSGTENGQNYNIYTIPVKLKDNLQTSFSIQASVLSTEEALTSSAIRMQSVEVVSADNYKLEVDTTQGTTGVQQFYLDSDNLVKLLTTSSTDTTNYYFAIPVGTSYFKLDQASYKIEEQSGAENVSISMLQDGKFSTTGYSVGEIGATRKILIKIAGYEEKDGIISKKDDARTLNVEFAVYNPAKRVVVESVSQKDIFYIREVDSCATSVVRYRVETEDYKTPTKKIEFSIGSYENIYQFSASINIICRDNHDTCSLKSGHRPYGWLNSRFGYDSNGNYFEFKYSSQYQGNAEKEKLYKNATNGRVEIYLNEYANNSEHPNGFGIKISLQAIAFQGTENQIYSLTTEEINVLATEQPNNIKIYGGDLVITNNSPEIQASFLTEGQNIKTFSAEAEFLDGELETGKTRYNGLGYCAYKYSLDANGDIIYSNGQPVYTKVGKTPIIMSYNSTTKLATVRVRESADVGGLYKLVIYAQSSYNPDAEFEYDKYVELTVRVSDGKNVAYVINNEQDFWNINNDLTAKYVLNNNIILNNSSAIGLNQETNLVTAFTGELSGKITRIIGNTTQQNRYSITINSSLVGLNSDETSEKTYYGLFTLIGKNANISNLTINYNCVNQTVSSGQTNGAFMGVLAGENAGTVENVSLYINSSILVSGNNPLTFGGLVGSNSSLISNCNVEANLKIDSSVKSTIALITGTNSGTITGGYKGKSSLNSIKFDVVANLEIINSSETENQVFNIGGIVGENSNEVKNLIIGGKISFKNAEHKTATGYMAGICANNSSTIITCTALGLDLIDNSNSLNVAGAVGLNSGTITEFRFVSVGIVYEFGTIYGKIEANNLAGVCVSNTGIIEYSTVENFVTENKIVDNKQFRTLNGENVYGIALGLGNVNSSFVNANISGANVWLISSNSNSNSYFIGIVDGDGVIIKNTDCSYYSYKYNNNTYTNGTKPILTYNGEPLEIIQPTDIELNPNENYKKLPTALVQNSVVIVNFMLGGTTESNTHNLITTKSEKGIFDLTVIPENAQAGVEYLLLADGYKYAYLQNGENGQQLVLTNPSYNNPIQLKCYSVFNNDLYQIVEIYSLPLLEKLNIINNEQNKITLYSGQQPQLVSLEAINKFGYSTLLDITGIENYLKIKSSETTKVDVNVEHFGSTHGVVLTPKENASGEEQVTLSLYLKKEYFNNEKITQDIALKDITFNLDVVNNATLIELINGEQEISSNGLTEFGVNLKTSFVGNLETKSFSNTEKSSYGEYKIGEAENADYLIAWLTIESGNEQVNKLLTANNENYLIDLFNITATKTYLENYGFNYAFSMELKDNFYARYITDSIKLKLNFRAFTNELLSNSVNLTINPTQLSTMRIATYKAENVKNAGYTNIIKSGTKETLIISPVTDKGIIMQIYLEPEYSNIENAKITSSYIKVPSLNNKEVCLNFTQLVLNGDNFETIYSEKQIHQVGNSLELQKYSIKTTNGYEYNGIIYVYCQIEKFSGLEAEISATVSIEQNQIEKTAVKTLLTSFTPGVSLVYDGIKISDQEDSRSYLIQEGSTHTFNALAYGYEYSDIRYEVSWYGVEEGEEKVYDGKLIGDYVSIYTNRTVKTENVMDNSITLIESFAIRKNMPAPFIIKATMSLTDQFGATVNAEYSLIFYPTDYIIEEISVADSDKNEVRFAVNQAKTINLKFTTSGTGVSDYSEEIYKKLYETFNQGISSLFTYNGTDKKLDETFSENPEFEVKYIDTKFTLAGNQQFNGTIKLTLPISYEKTNNLYKIKFSSNGEFARELTLTIRLSIYVSETEEDAIPIYSAREFTQMGEGQHYILMNDLILENFTPITAKIGSLDGNNKIIQIRSFNTSSNSGNFGLFDTISTYQDSEQQQRKTILKNVVVDYGYLFDDGFSLVDYQSIIFGGLVANNDGGLIYNCDVINSSTTEKVINIFIENESEESTITFGGLVGVNSGVITNSRVGRSSFEKITINGNSSSIKNLTLNPIKFEVKNNSNNNGFASKLAGFVGTNSNVISSSYVANTSLINYSTNSTINETAGFVAENTGRISYSYIRAKEDSLSIENPYATGCIIESKGNGKVAGFVYKNDGTITNSYSNIELKTNSAYIAGFVYDNSNAGSISESYSACKMNSGSEISYAEQPFVGADEKGVALTNKNLTNVYYLLDEEDVSSSVTVDSQVIGLNVSNFQNENNLFGFVFVLSTSSSERSEGIWSYYNINGMRRILPELIIADKIAVSCKFFTESSTLASRSYEAKYYDVGSSKNPYIIRSVEEFNSTFKPTNDINSKSGYFRLIDDIDFGETEASISTRTKFTLGSNEMVTSLDGNGLKISGIYLDAEDKEIQDTLGLFGAIKNAYIKNLNLNFKSSNLGINSSALLKYSGGLAGKIEDSAIINVKLDGTDTTIVGQNLVGGLAGLIKGQSVIYGIETNLSAMAVTQSNADEATLYNSNLSEDEIKKLSFAGGVAGVIDLTEKPRTNNNVSYITINGNSMAQKAENYYNISADYVGGVAGYANNSTSSLGLNFDVGVGNKLFARKAVGGLYGVYYGKLEASKVSSEDNQQFEYDKTIGKFVISLETATSEKPASLDNSNIGNIKLINSNSYAGGLIGVSVGANVSASYAKASLASAETMGGLIGTAISTNITYSYAVPYINTTTASHVGGLIGATYGRIDNIRKEKFNAYVNNNWSGYSLYTNVSYCFASLIMDKVSESSNYGYICANSGNSLRGNNDSVALNETYYGKVKYSSIENGSRIDDMARSISNCTQIDLFKLYDLDNAEQYYIFTNVFSSWSVIKHWYLDSSKYFPLLSSKVSDNYIIIKDSSDIQKMATNPEGNFKIIDDISITSNTNWVVSTTFKGTILGGTNNNTTPTITVTLKPNTQDSFGFFKETNGASITNLNIGYKTIEATENNLTMFGGLTCLDTDSTISNVFVSYKDSGNSLLNNNIKISAFGGIVGQANSTSLSSSSFSGKVIANMSDSEEIYFGGLVAKQIYNKMQEEESSNKNSIISSTVSNSSFTINLNDKKNANIAGAVGLLEQATISSVNVGDVASNDIVELKVNKANSKSLYLGGVVGQSNQGTIISCTGLVNSVLTSANTQSSSDPTTISDNNASVGGLVGYYDIKDNTKCSGIKSSSTQFNFENKGNFTKLSVSAGIGEMVSGIIDSCLFTGKIDTSAGETSSSIATLYTAGALASYKSNYENSISETMTTTELHVAGVNIDNLRAGGLVGGVEVNNNSVTDKMLSISNSVSANKIYLNLQFKNDDAKYYVGGMVGASSGISLNKNYSVSTIFANKVLTDAITSLTYDAILATNLANNASSSQTYFSSDISLAPDNNNLAHNIPAYSLTYDNAWSGELTKLTQDEYGQIQDSAFTNLNSSGLPYITSLMAQLIRFDIIINNSFVLGSALKPNVITGNYTFNTDFNYYIINTATENNTLPTLSGNLNGVLIGEDKIYNNSSINNAVEGMLENSAISNLHINVATTEETAISSAIGLIVNENTGTIFNSSVSGVGIKIKGADLGVICLTNTGIVAYSYSNIEILSADKNISGLVHTNENVISSSYFTGYIKSSSPTNGLVFKGKNSLVYNSYMAGVIVAEAQIEELATGKKVYLDKYASKNVGVKADSLTSVDSLELIQNTTSAGQLLVGNWHNAFSEGTISFGYNYSYPIYAMNKLDETSAGNVIDCKTQLYTGNGTYSPAVDLEARYNNLETNIDDYTNAYKISHLGVLRSLELINYNLNYVIVYDIEGKGQEFTTINSNSFNGLIVTNKNFAFTSDIVEIENEEDLTEEQINQQKKENIRKNVYCIINNIKTSGLIANVGNAYFANIGIGNVEILQAKDENNKPIASGVLIQSTGAGEITIQNVYYSQLENNLDSGKNPEIKGTGTYSALIGSLNENSTITIKAFNNSMNIDPSSTKGPQLSGGDNAGLFVANLNGGTLVGDNAQIMINSLCSAEKAYGGLVGISNGGGKIKNFILNSNQTVVQTQYFGVVLGKLENEESVLANLELSNLTINGKYINSKGSIASLVAYQNGNIDLDNITMASEKLTIEAQKAGDGEETATGGLVAVHIAGRLDGTIYSNASNFSITGRKNVGGYFGLYNGDISISLSVKTDNSATQETSLATIKVFSAENVGGVFGSLSSNDSRGNLNFTNYNPILIIANKEDEDKGVKAEVQNVGGIVGYMPDGTINGATNNGKIELSAGIVNEEYILSKKSATDKNVQAQAINVGGIVGYVGQNVKILNCKSNAVVQGYQNVGGIVGQIVDNTEQGIDSNTVSDSAKITGVINVGGVVGYSNSGTITNSKTEEDKQIHISGVANVGGVVGFANGGTISSNNISSQIKAVYYNYLYTETNIETNNEEEKNACFIPTSVGGLAGGVNGTTEIVNNTISTNITSSEEGKTSSEISATEEKYKQTISTNKNFTLDMAVGEGNEPKFKNLIKFTNNSQQIKFDNMQTGFGGFVGTFDKATSLTNVNVDDINKLKVQINASLGVNVGSYFGVFKGNIDENTFKTFPTLDCADPNIVGGYNIGGVVGFVVGDVKQEENGEISNTLLKATEKTTIKVQPNGTGMYVGGLFGKVALSNNQIATVNKLRLESATINFSINASNSFYVGGIVGRLEGNMINSSNRYTEDKDKNFLLNNDNTNFGGLVGMLKVKNNQLQIDNDGQQLKNESGSTVKGATVKGEHYYAFTVNTIENENYADGGSDFNFERQDGTLYLYSSAYYINQDSFDISATSQTNYYSPNLSQNNNFTKNNGGYYLNRENGEYTKVNIHDVKGYFEKIYSLEEYTLQEGDNNKEFYIKDGFYYVAKRYVSSQVIDDMIKNKETVYIATCYEKPYDTSPLDTEIPYYIDVGIFDILYNITILDMKKIYNEKNTDTTWYGLISEIRNPLIEDNNSAWGWAKEYTGFRAIQRYINQTDNNLADWDSTAVVYDAVNISEVGTVENLDLEGCFYGKDGENRFDENDSERVIYTVYANSATTNIIYTPIGIGRQVTEEYCNDTYSYYTSGTGKDGYKYEKLSFAKDDLNDFTNYNGDPDKVEIVKRLTYYNFDERKLEDVITGQDIVSHSSAVADYNYIQSYLGKLFEYKTFYANSTTNGNGTIDKQDRTTQDPVVSGSMFDVASYQPTFITNDQKDNLAWLKIIGIVLLAIAGVATIKAFGIYSTSIFVTTLFVGSTISDAIGGLIDKNYLIMYLTNESYLSSYLSKKGQNFGVLSPTHITEVKYENGKMKGDFGEQLIIKAFTNSTDVQTYYFVSKQRPSDFANSYIKINEDGTIEPLFAEDSEPVEEFGEKSKIQYKVNKEHTAYKKYIYYNGAYYCNVFALDIGYTFSGESIDTSGLKQSNYKVIKNSGLNYVYGAFYNEDYSYSYKSQDGNELQFNNGDGKYFINNKEIRKEQAEKTVSQSYYYTGNTNYSTTDCIEGYDYFVGAYYTPYGNNTLGTKCATYTRLDGELSDEQQKYLGSTYLKFECKDPDSIIGYDENNNPVYGTAYVYYEISEIADGNSGKDIESLTKDLKEKDIKELTKPITVNIYPYSLTNPYKEGVAEKAVANSKDDVYYVSKPMGMFDEGDSTLSANVTYFLYYKLTDDYICDEKTNNVYKKITETTNTKIEVYSDKQLLAEITQDDLKNIIINGGLTINNGEQDIQYTTDKLFLINISTYLTDLTPKEQNNLKNFYNLANMYRIKDNALYKRSDDITQGSSDVQETIPGLAYTTYFRNGEDYYNLFIQGKFLSNKDYGVYTLFKYTVIKGEAFDFIDKYVWNGYYIIPNEKEFTGVPNKTLTYLVESVKTTLGGAQQLNKTGTGQYKSGKISIS